MSNSHYQHSTTHPQDRRHHPPEDRKRWAHLLFPRHLDMANNAALWADRISAKLGFDANGCIMFVDGTGIKCYRQSVWQRLMFNGLAGTTRWAGRGSRRRTA